jgi:hypothetical protein
LKEIRKYEFGIVSNGITPIPDFVKIRPGILQLLEYRLMADVSCEEIWSGWVRLG